MKHNIFKSLVIAASLLLCGSLTSCLEKGHTDLTGKYTPPTELTIVSGEIISSVKESGLTTNTLLFKTKENVDILIGLVSSKYYPATTTYTKIIDKPKNGNYVNGSTIGGKEILDGSLVLVENGEDYTFKNSIFFTDSTPYKVSGSAKLVFVKPAAEYNVATLTYEDPLVVYDMGGNPTTYEGVAQNKIEVKSKEGNLLGYFELTSASDAESLAGTYTIVSALNAANQANNGWDASAWVPGMFGGCYIVEDGNNYIITEGAIEVKVNEEGSIAISGTGIKTTKVGGTDAGPTEFSIEDIFFDYGLLCTVASTPLKTYDENWQEVTVPGVTDNNITLYIGEAKAENVVGNIEVSTEDGSTLFGKFPVTATYNAAGLANNGGNVMGMFDYGCWIKGAPSEAPNYITTGDVIISEIDGGYAIKAGNIVCGICKLVEVAGE
ncbi:MAG: hypothetical protein HUJ95_05885 [Bacteroidales bacterium]|nr:hypothetical protein [Bacteroidales bacterium]